MKVVHVIKRIEMIDLDIKELKKLEKSLTQNKSFTTPIYMSIEKQINLMLGERIKLLELKIENPPAHIVEEIEGKKIEAQPEQPVIEKEPAVENEPAVEIKTVAESKAKPKMKPQPVKAAPSPRKAAKKVTLLDEEIPMLSQDDIDARFSAIQSDRIKSAEKTIQKKEPAKDLETAPSRGNGDEHVKLLDIALQKGALDKKEIDKEKDRRVRFFRENFPSE